MEQGDPDRMNKSAAAAQWLRWALRAAILGVILLHVLEVLSLRGQIGSDYRLFYAGAERFLSDPMALYPEDAKQSLQGYLYPPPSVLLFLPLVLGSLEESFGWASVAILACALSACVMWLQLLRADEQVARDRLAEVVILGLALATGSMLAVRQGQVDTIILLLCVLPVWLDSRGLPRLAGAVIAVGCWIKIYPVLMLFWIACRPEWRRLGSGFVVAAIAIPLLSLTVIPIELYLDYLLNQLPSMSSRAIIHIDNQSLAGILVRSVVPLEDAVRLYSSLQLPSWFRAAMVLAMLGGMSAVVWRTRQTEAPALLVAGWAMALACLVAPLGWGHTYCLLLPLFIHVMRIALAREHWAECAAAGACYLALLLPAHHRLAIDTQIPGWAAQLFYARYAIAACVLLILSWHQAGSRARDRASRLTSPVS